MRCASLQSFQFSSFSTVNIDAEGQGFCQGGFSIDFTEVNLLQNVFLFWQEKGKCVEINSVKPYILEQLNKGLVISVALS